MRWAGAVIGIALGGCGPEVGPVFTCADAMRELREPGRPARLERAGPMTVGEVLPQYRLSKRARDADQLAAEAMVLACAVAGTDLVPTDEFHAWAEAAGTEATAHAEAPFVGTQLTYTYFRYADGSFELFDVAVLDTPTQFEHSPDEGDVAEAIQVGVDVLDRLEAYGVPAGWFDREPLQVNVSATPGISDGYGLVFGYTSGGIEISGPSLCISLDADKRIERLFLSDIDIEEIDRAPVVLDESMAEERFRELVEGMDDVETEPSDEGAPFYTRTGDRVDGVYGVSWVDSYQVHPVLRQVAALSMHEATPNLVPIAP